MMNLNKKLHYLSFVTIPEKEKFFNYLKYFLPYNQVNDQELKERLLKQEK
jgi:hypothetical protein